MAVGEWDQRQLCPDGGCVGVIGADGVCKVCGRAAQNWGDERTRGLLDPPDEDDDELAAGSDEDDDYDEDDPDSEDDEDEDDDEQDEDDEAEPASSAGDTASAAPDWAARQLCPDDSCIGLIGANGRCKVCGRAAAGASPPAELGDANLSQPGPAGIPEPTGTAEDPRPRCADSLCSGTIRPDGQCEVCGKVTT